MITGRPTLSCPVCPALSYARPLVELSLLAPRLSLIPRGLFTLTFLSRLLSRWPPFFYSPLSRACLIACLLHGFIRRAIHLSPRPPAHITSPGVPCALLFSPGNRLDYLRLWSRCVAVYHIIIAITTSLSASTACFLPSGPSFSSFHRLPGRLRIHALSLYLSLRHPPPQISMRPSR